MPTATKTTTRKRAAKRRTSGEAPDVYQVVTDRIVEQLEKGVVPWRPMWRSIDPTPRNLSTGNPYTGANWLLFLMMGYQSPYWVTFNQAKALGGTVRKGEASTPGVRWVEWTRKLSEKEAQEAIAKGEKVQRDEAGRAILHARAPKLFRVFNIEQCDGLTAPPQPEHEPNQWEPIDQAEAIWRAYIDSDEGPAFSEGGSSAHYTPADDRITMPQRTDFAEADDYYHVAFHEAIHSTGHPERLARELKMAREPYSREELIAEIGAAMLCAKATLPIPAEQSAAYIDGYLKALRGDSRLVYTAASAAQRGADLILGAAR